MTTTALAQAVISDINRVRSSHGLGAVSEDGRMDEGASAHSQSMARHHTFAHGRWFPRVRRYAGTSTVGEILAYAEPPSPGGLAHEVVRAWMHSPEHRAVILTGDFHRAGVGRAWARWNGRRTAIFTVDFAA